MQISVPPLGVDKTAFPSDLVSSAAMPGSSGRLERVHPGNACG